MTSQAANAQDFGLSINWKTKTGLELDHEGDAGFVIGDVVRLRHDPGRSGEVASERRLLGGRAYLKVRMADGSGNQQFPVDQLEAVAVAPDALADLSARAFSSPQALRRLITHVRLTGRLSDMIYSMEATNTDFLAYQFKPVIKLLNSPSRGLLIADEVGLGKTIEAGLVWTELVARYDVSRLLVVCPKSLTEKWKLELRNKFAVWARIVDAAGLLTALKDESETGEGFAVICSLPSLRPPSDWDDTPAAGNARAALAYHLRDEGGDGPLFDLAVFDEAHHLRNPETAQHALGRLVMDAADHRLLLSATPINLQSGDLRSLLRLLDPDTFESEYLFAVMEAENRPLVAAREKALDRNGSLAELLAFIRAIPAGTILKTDRRMAMLVDRLSGPVRDGPDLRAGIAAELEAMSLLGSIVNRTRRRDVSELQVKRRASVREWRMTDAEKHFYDTASNVVRQHAWEIPANDRFLLATPQRLIASSLPAAYRHWLARAVDYSVDDPDVEQESAGPLVAKLAALCAELDIGDALEAGDTKYELLRTALAQTWEASPNEKLIVFSSFRRTIDYLADRLQDDGVAIERLHGSIDEERMDVLDRFAAAEGPVVLLTSEIGGEGLDLQFCRIMVNYDLPWNPMKVEQRIGRIDRIGQKSPSIEIMSLVCADTIEAQVYQRLYVRIGIIEQTLGAFEAILGQAMVGLERRLLDPELTEEEQARELDRAALAMETRQQQEAELEEEAAGLIAHGDTILERIYENYRSDRRVSSDELADYVASAMEGRFPGNRFEPEADGRQWQARLSPAAHMEFVRFMDQNSRRVPTRFRRFATVSVVFGKGDPRSGGPEVISPTHPLVRFASHMREQSARRAAPRPAIAVKINRDQMPAGLERGTYAFAIQSWSARGLVRSDRLAYAALNLSSNELVGPDEAESLCRIGSQNGSTFEPSGDLVDRAALRIEAELVNGDLLRRFEDFEATERARHDDRAATDIAQLERHRDRQRERDERRHAEWAASGNPNKLRILPASLAKLEKFLARMDRRIEDAQRRNTFSLDEEITLAVGLVELA